MYNSFSGCFVARLLMALGLSGLAAAGGAEEPPELHQDTSIAQPTPEWAKLVEVSTGDEGLAGYRAPAGLQVEIAAAEPLVINPMGIRFDTDGSLLVLRWVGEGAEIQPLEVRYSDGSTRQLPRWVKTTPDRLDRCVDTNGDGRFDRADTVMDDLQLPSTVVSRDGSFWFTTRGSVLRRTPVKDRPGQWAEVRPVIGMAGWHEHQASGLTFSPDGWLYITEGDEDSYPEALDGSRSQVLRTGAIWRVRPEGASLELFALGFRNPFRDVVLDDVGNLFHADNDNEDGSRFQGCRLLHLLEGSDHGWRLAEGMSCCVPDHERGAVFGERPGRVPALLKTGRGSPAGLLYLASDRFPERLNGLLVWPDVVRRSVRAYRVARAGATFEVVEELTLLEAPADELFRPCQVVIGPDGALYVCDWRTNSTGNNGVGDQIHGRILRLTWRGDGADPALPRASLDRWTHVANAPEGELVELLSSAEQGLRFRALDRLASSESGRALLPGIACDRGRPVRARAAAAFALGRALDPSGIAALTRILAEDGDEELRRVAVEQLGHAPGKLAGDKLLEVTIAALGDGSPAVRRSAAIASANLELRRRERSPAVERRLLEALRASTGTDRFLEDGLLRALEKLGRSALQPLLELAGSTDAAARGFAVRQLAALRGRLAAEVLDDVLENAAERLTQAELTAILEARGQIQTEPPVGPGALAGWIEKHPGASDGALAVALHSLVLLGRSDGDRVVAAVLRLLEAGGAPLRLSALRSIARGKLLRAAAPLVKRLTAGKLDEAEELETVRTLAQLRSVRRWAQSKFEDGVDGESEALAELCSRLGPGQVRRELLVLLGGLRTEAALPIAEPLLRSGDAADVGAAIEALSADPGQAEQMAKLLIDGKIAAEHLTRVVSALDRHLAGSRPSAELRNLREQVLKRGLAIDLDPRQVARVEELVRTRGNASRGLKVLSDEKRAACLRCHRLEGKGGAVGPDLTGLHRSLGPAKLLESILAPSLEVKESFAAWVAVTRAGQAFSGIKISETAERVTLRDAEGRDVTLARNDLESLERSRTSLMPDGVAALLTLEELLDLVRFLSDGEAQAAWKSAGTP